MSVDKTLHVFGPCEKLLQTIKMLENARKKEEEKGIKLEIKIAELKAKLLILEEIES